MDKNDMQMDSAESPFVNERLRLMRDAAANNLSAPVSAIVGILLVPVMLKALGQDNYGVWIIATSISGILIAVDFGLSWSITRAVAAEGDAADFVSTALNIYLLMGVAGCLIMGGAGMLSGMYLHLPPVGRRTVISVFWLIGGSFLADQISAFSFSVLAGLRRFKSINIIGSFASIVWAVWAVVILLNGGSVIAVVACQFAITALKGTGTLWFVTRLNPGIRFRPGFFKWDALSRRASFALSSVLMAVLGGVAWNSAPVLIGFIRGSAAVVPFYIGQKFPLAVLMIAWRAAEVLFPAASECQHDIVKGREVLQAGSRLVMVLTLPATALLFVAAPNLLHAWIGNPPPGSVTVMRVLTATVFLDTVSASPLYLLFGRGIMRPIVAADAVKGIGVVAFTLVFVYSFGVTGAAWGMLVPIGAASVALFAVASREYSMDLWKFAADIWRGLWMPVSACILGALFVLYYRSDGRLWVFASVAAGGIAYLAVLGYSGNDDEKKLAREVYHGVRSTVAKVPFLRNAWHFARAFFEFVRDPWRKPSYFERHFATPDPWGYETGEDHKRLLRALSMLENIQQGKFRQALEVGCAEGIFTRMLAERCESLVAADFAPTALKRARMRLPNTQVHFDIFDLRHDPIPGTFELITAMDVLDTIFRPDVLKRVRDKLVGALEPGGYLLLVSTRQDKMFETEWWGRLLLRGGKNISDFIATHPCLRMVSADTTETHVFALFRKVRA
jgi:O-antigen/teichoic acid export membrane protein/cyclopropane fatty-acyl-phospholipid synthase-like methyltransferase